MSKKYIRYLQNKIQKPSTKTIDMRDFSLHAVLGVTFVLLLLLVLTLTVVV